MADNHEPATPPRSAMDYSEHEYTYNLFGKMLKWGVIACIVILLLMLAFCTPNG
jgi:hypothetical protein